MNHLGRKLERISTALLFSVFLISCSQDRVSGGNSSETPNTLAGRLVDTTGAARVGDTVEIRPAQWISDDLPSSGADRSWRAYTDSSGRFQFVGVPSGSYVVESRGAAGGFLSEEVSVGAGRPVADLGTDTACGLQEVNGRVIADTSLIDSTAEVHVYGTDHHASVDKSGAFRFGGLPTGKVRLLAVLGRSSQAARAKDEFRLPRQGLIAPRLLAPTSFATEDYSRWPHLRKARIRFSPQGWYLPADQPLVPIRVHIDATVMPGAWAPTGASLRFSDSVGNKLPYEIESWDPVAHRAEVWVRLQNTDKGSDLHYLWMYWGRNDAVDWSDGTKVFDTAQGWVGVWHLSGTDPWKDATANHLRLVPTAAVAENGLVSGGLRLDPRSRLVAEGAALQGWQDAAVSLWGRIDTIQAAASLARLGALDVPDSSDWVLGVTDSAGTASVNFRTQANLRNKSNGLTGTFGKGKWTLLGGAFSRPSPRARLIVNDSAQALYWKDSFVVHTNTNAFVVGGRFGGVVDEIRLHRIGVHPDALRMQWGTDRDASPVLEWAP